MNRQNPIKALQGFVIALLIVGIFGCSSERVTNPTAWKLDAEASQLSLFVIKANAVGETFMLKLTEGSVSKEGAARIFVDLASIETGIPIRNERMREHLFDVSKWTTAQVSGQIDLSNFPALEVGKSIDFSSALSVNMHGLSKKYQVQFTITRISANAVRVQSAQPIAVRAKDFGLMPGVNKLQQLAKLSSITPVVAVDFSLVFEGA